MKKFLMLCFAVCGMLFFAGCSEKVDENKTPEQIKAELASMDAADIQEMITKYQKAIEEKTAELKVEVEKLAKIPLTEQLGEEAKKIRANQAEITKSLDKLKANLAAYAEGLKTKK